MEFTVGLDAGALHFKMNCLLHTIQPSHNQMPFC